MASKRLRSLLIGEDPLCTWSGCQAQDVHGLGLLRAAEAPQCRSSPASTSSLYGDIVGKKLGEPVWYRLLGGAYSWIAFDHTPAPCSVSTPEGMMTEAYVEVTLNRASPAVKFGWGLFGEDPERDLDLVAAARNALGARADLLIDTGWYIHRTAKEAIQMVRRLEPFRPFLIEEPLSRPRGLRRLRRARGLARRRHVDCLR